MEGFRPRIILMGSGGFLGAELYKQLIIEGYSPERRTIDLSLLKERFSNHK